MLEIDKFINTHPQDPEVKRYYQHPVCANVERGFSKVTKGQFNPEYGTIYLFAEETLVPVAQFFRGPVLCLQEWFPDPNVGEVTALVKNPTATQNLQKSGSIGSTNALLEYNGYLMVAVPVKDAFIVRRPVRWHYQQDLKRYFHRLSQMNKATHWLKGTNAFPGFFRV